MSLFDSKFNFIVIYLEKLLGLVKNTWNELLFLGSKNVRSYVLIHIKS